MLINKYTWDDMPDFSVSTNTEITKMKNAWSVVLNKVTVPLDIAKTASKKLSITIDGTAATYEQYLTYFKWQVQNYWLDQYIATKPATTSTSVVAESIDENEDINGLEYIRKSTDKKWNVYKYTLPSDNPMADPSDFLTITKAWKKFTWKTIQLTDENGTPFTNPSDIPSKKWDVIYIKEKINS